MANDCIMSALLEGVMRAVVEADRRGHSGHFRVRRQLAVADALADSSVLCLSFKLFVLCRLLAFSAPSSLPMRISILAVAALAFGALAASLPAASAVRSTAAPTGTCHALAMAGGGDRAAYEAGVIRGLVDNLAKEEVAYNVVTGISAGSTLTAAFSVYLPCWTGSCCNSC